MSMKSSWQTKENNVKFSTKWEVIKIKELTLQEWIPIKEIDKEGFIKLKNNNLIKILKVKPLTYNLKSDLEKE